MARQTIEETVNRFNAALENLQLALERRRLSEDGLAQMEDDLHLMALDRAALARALDAAMAKTKNAGEVSARLDKIVGTIDALIETAEAA